VVDGETLRVATKVITLLGVAAPPRGETCHRADGSAFDCGTASAAALAGLVRDRVVDCRVVSEDSGGRAEGICHAAGTQLNKAQITQGWARPTDQASALNTEDAPPRR
jgi:endonuclease YncB( thermonuclease family)